jgi:hypothetical protein
VCNHITILGYCIRCHTSQASHGVAMKHLEDSKKLVPQTGRDSAWRRASNIRASLPQRGSLGSNTFGRVTHVHPSNELKGS